MAEFEARKKRASENPAEVSNMMLHTFNEMMEEWKNWSTPELAMVASLLRKLQAGKLEAFGVRSAPKQKRQLELIPSHFFMDAKINWEGNKVTNFGATYSTVRVRRTLVVGAGRSREEALNTAAMALASTPAKLVPELLSDISRRKPGPPSAAQEVIAAYESMLQNGDVRQGMTIKAIYQKLLPILERNSTMFPNGRGLAYSSIARHLRSHVPGSLKFSS
jgi:hypothetical protein